MGNVLTTNIGPNGETYEYYSTCGPVVSPDTPLYDLNAAYEEVGDLCVKAGELEFGPLWEQKFAIGLVWFTVISSIALFIFYLYQTWKATCGWEEMYVVIIETLKVLVEMKLEFSSPAMMYHTNGVTAPWIRYAEWLLTCPVILIHLSNLTGLKSGYSKRTMFLLVSDLGTIVWGISAANSKGAAKAVFFFIGLCYATFTFYNAARVYIESYHMVPKGLCQKLVMILAWMFFTSWAMFPIAFIAGPEGSKTLSYAGSTIAHTVADLLSKNLWGFIANYLRVCIHKHIIKYGDLRKKVKVQVAGQEVEVEQYVEEEDDETVKHSTAALASRGSFIAMRNDMNARGIETRASLDLSGQAGYGVMGGGAYNASMGGGKMPVHINPGRVILGVTDPGTAEALRAAFALLPAPIEVVPCMGAQNVWSMCQQAANQGGFDFVLLHPEYLRDRTGGSLLAALKNNNVKVAAFAWEPVGFVRDVIDGAQVQGYIAGPNPMNPPGIDTQELLLLVARMQGTLNAGLAGGAIANQMAMAGMGGIGPGGIRAEMQGQDMNGSGYFNNSLHMGGTGQTFNNSM